MNIQRSRAGTKSNMFKDKQLSNPQSQLTEVCLLSDGDSWASPICRGSPSSLNDITVTSLIPVRRMCILTSYQLYHHRRTLSLLLCLHCQHKNFAWSSFYMTDLLSCETTEASKICQVVFDFEFWCFLSLWAAESDWEQNSALAILIWTGNIYPQQTHL